jgi:hypothetical protein
MKKISLSLFLFLTGFLYSEGQICSWKAAIATSDVTIIGRKETKTAISLQVDADNNGTCIWEKNEVYMKVSVTTVPVGVAKSDAEDIFKAGQKIYLNNGHVTKGGTGRFIAKLDHVDVAGMYVLEVAIYNKANKEIGSSSTIRFRFTD